MALLGTRGTTIAVAAAASCHHPHAMAYHHSCNGGSTSTYYSASPVAFGTSAAGQAPQLDVFEYLSDEGVPSSAVPAAPFGTPPPRMPAQHVVPGVSGYDHSRPRVPGHTYISRSAVTVAEEGARRTDRIAFRTRSEEEVLDDGYKWRKYGKKSVKNSPNPRNYYRCSTDGCNVKKRVERERDDPTYVVTMYEGVHNHASPGTVYYATQDGASGCFFVTGMHHPGS